MFEHLQLISIILEAAIALLLFLAAFRGRPYLYGLTLTFAIYVWYDLARYLDWTINPDLLSGVFFVATLGALYSAWSLYKR
jgi:hypothetical protein